MAAAAGDRFAGGVVLDDGDNRCRSAKASARFRSLRRGHGTQSCRNRNPPVQADCLHAGHGDLVRIGSHTRNRCSPGQAAPNR